MTLQFNSTKLPHRNSEAPFGFVQTRYSPLSVSDFDEPLPKCPKCKSHQFPLKAAKFACPICAPDSDFVEGSLRLTYQNSKNKNNKKIAIYDKNRSLFYFAFDLSFPIESIQFLLNSLFDSMSETDSIVIFSISSPTNTKCTLTLISVKNSVPFFTEIDGNGVSNFVPSNEYEVNKNDIKNVIIPSLFALYSIYSSSSLNNENDIPLRNQQQSQQLKEKETKQIDLIPLVQFLIRQSSKQSFAAFLFLNSPISPLTVEKTAAASRTVASSNGIIHIGARESFKRLTALTRLSFGCVFGISEISPSTIKKLVELSRPQKIKIIAPRFIEAAKVTGSDGSMNMTAYVTRILLTQVRGCSCKINVDFSRVDQCYISTARVIEVTHNTNGRFITLHSFGWSESREAFETRDQSAMITANLVLKGCASDVLRGAWMGEDWAKLVGRFMSPEKIDSSILFSTAKQMDSSKPLECCTKDVGAKPDRDALRLYYILGCLTADLTNRVIKLEKGGFLFVSPPIAYVFLNREENMKKISATTTKTTTMTTTTATTTDSTKKTAQMTLERSENDAVAVVEQNVQSEWPFEVCVFTDLSVFRLLVEKLGGKLD